MAVAFSQWLPLLNLLVILALPLMAAVNAQAGAFLSCEISAACSFLHPYQADMNLSDIREYPRDKFNSFS